MGFTPETIDFLWGIRFNNRRDWFQEHKKEYENFLYQPMLSLAQKIQERISLNGTVVKVSRIYRDVRYSQGIPYKDHLWLCIREDHVFWSEHPSLYFQIDPEGGSAGFIDYAPKAQIMAEHRRQVLEKPEEFCSMIQSILSDSCLHDKSTRYKRLKDGGNAEIDTWYQLKNCYVEESIPVGEELFCEDLAEHLIEIFTKLLPLYHYFRKLEA